MLLQTSRFADPFYACLLNGLAQGLPLKQVQEECETKLSFEGRSGTVGGIDKQNPLEGQPGSRPPTDYDPANITAKCAAGDPRVAAGATLREGSVEVLKPYGLDQERYTYGGKGESNGYGTDRYGQVGVIKYKGLSEAESRALKEAAIKEWQDAYKALEELEKKQTEELEKSGKKPEDWENDPKMKADREAAQKRLEDAADKKDEDPNAQLGGITRPSTTSACETALQAAREIVGECQMNGWRSGPCKELQAELKGCPDPKLIYVSPEGYACRPDIDPKALLTAWVEACRELKRPVPGGPDPCSPPHVDPSSRYMTGDASQVCGGPEVYVTPDNPDPRCVKKLELPSFTKTTHEIYVWGLNKLGGPIVVFGPRPQTDPNPKPGPEPRPAPKQ